MWVESESREVLSNLGFLKKCLVGRWDGSSNRLPTLDALNLWARHFERGFESTFFGRQSHFI